MIWILWTSVTNMQKIKKKYGKGAKSFSRHCLQNKKKHKTFSKNIEQVKPPASLSLIWCFKLDINKLINSAWQFWSSAVLLNCLKSVCNRFVPLYNASMPVNSAAWKHSQNTVWYHCYVVYQVRLVTRLQLLCQKFNCAQQQHMCFYYTVNGQIITYHSGLWIERSVLIRPGERYWHVRDCGLNSPSDMCLWSLMQRQRNSHHTC